MKAELPGGWRPPCAGRHGGFFIEHIAFFICDYLLGFGCGGVTTRKRAEACVYDFFASASGSGCCGSSGCARFIFFLFAAARLALFPTCIAIDPAASLRAVRCLFVHHGVALGAFCAALFANEHMRIRAIAYRTAFFANVTFHAEAMPFAISLSQRLSRLNGPLAPGAACA